MVLDPSLFDVTRSADLSLSLLPSVIDEYLLTCKLDGKSPDTRDTYESRLKTFCQYLVDNKYDLAISRLNVHHIRYFLAFLIDREVHNGEKTKLSTANAYYRCLHRFFEWCLLEGYIPKDRSPMNNINPPQIPKTKPKPFSPRD